MIKIKNLTKSYDKSEILKNANYTFPKEGLVCLLGPSGCGKSTLLNLIAGFDTEYKGSISVGEEALSLLKPDDLCNYRKDNVGFIFQDYHLISGYTVLENVLLPCDLSDEPEKNNIERAKEILSKLGIESKGNEKIENLSGGQKQRVSIARALMKSPSILLADEPTGALDRQTSNEIMALLKSISKDILVVVITHDKKVSSYADEIIRIENKEIISVENMQPVEIECKEDIKIISKVDRTKKNNRKQVDTKSRAKKNFKVHMKQFITVAIVIALGISSFILSMSSQRMMNSSIEKFKEKNTAFNNGYIKNNDKIKDEDVLNLLTKDTRVGDAYYQYRLENITLSIDGKEESLEYVPMAKANESLSYGVMPRVSEEEISITPSLAKKFSKDINKLIGKKIILTIGDYKKELTISGIYNADYDNMFVSSDIEKDIYNKVEHSKDIYSISYDVKTFEDVLEVDSMLDEKNIESLNASAEVENLINTFSNIKKLFLVVSIIIFSIALFLSIVLLSKLQNARYREIGLLAALGFNRNQIKSMILTENMMLSVISSIITLSVVGACAIGSVIFNIPLQINLAQIMISVVLTFIIVSVVSITISNKLVQTEPAKALRM